MSPAPLKAFTRSAAGVGVLQDARTDLPMYTLPLAVRDGDKAYPGFVTLLAALARRLPASSITVMPDRGVRIGKKTTIAAPDLAYRPLPPASGKKAERVPVISVARLWEPGFTGRRLKNKTVLIGATRPDLMPLARGPGGADLPPVYWAAHAVASLLELSHVQMPAAFYGLQRGIIILLACDLGQQPGLLFQLLL